MRIGEITLWRVPESEFPVLAPAEVYPECSPALIERNLEWLVPRFYDPVSQLLILAFQGFVVQSAGKNILVDTCVGDCKARKRPQFDQQRWNWLRRLKQAGFPPESIDYVVCTHFHVDHVGWNTQLVNGAWVPTFTNARYLFPRMEWDFWCSEQGKPNRDRTGDYLVDSIIPVVEAGLVDFVHSDHQIGEGVTMVPAPGHTPGQVCVDLESGGERAILAGDLLHSPLQLAYPEWSTRFCSDPDQSRRTRLDFLARYADSGVVVFPAHFPSPTGGYIERANSAYRFRFID